MIAITSASIAGTGSVRASADVLSSTETYYMFVFTNPSAGAEAEYNAWYEAQHLPDVVAVPGFVSAQRFVINDVQMIANAKLMLPRYLALYVIRTDNLQRVRDETVRRVKSGETKISASLDAPTADIYFYKAIGPKLRGKGGDAPGTGGRSPQSFAHFVFTVPIAGHDEDFNRWYDRHHAPDMASIPGFTSAQRLELVDGGPGPVRASHYAALFGIETRNFPSVIAAFHERAKSMVMEPLIDMQQTHGFTYRAIGPIIYGDAVRASRARN